MIVIDASVGIKWFRKTSEEFIDQALILLKNHLDDKEIITVPSLFYLEIANAMVTKTGYKEKIIRENLRFLNDQNLKIYSFTKDDYIESAMLSRKYKTTVYDMLYAVIARKLKTTLITADEKFVERTKFSYVKSLNDFK